MVFDLGCSVFLMFEFCSSFSVLQLCYNQLSGSIPTQLASLKKLTVIALQSNQLTGAIPASLGRLDWLVRVDLSSNHLFGSVPSRLADARSLEVLDVRNNTLSGNVPPGTNRSLNRLIMKIYFLIFLFCSFFFFYMKLTRTLFCLCLI